MQESSLSKVAVFLSIVTLGYEALVKPWSRLIPIPLSGERTKVQTVAYLLVLDGGSDLI